MGLALRRTVLTPGFNLYRLRSAFLGIADRLNGADDDAVATWTDVSGYGRNATQATGTKQPALKLAALNGRNVVRFTGADADRLSATISATAQPYAVAWVGTITTPVAAVMQVLNGTDSLIQASTTPTWQGFAGSTITGAAVTGSQVVIAYVNEASSFVQVNGTQTTGNAGTSSWTNMNIGASAADAGPTTGDMAHVQLIPNLRPREFRGLLRYLRGYYNL